MMHQHLLLLKQNDLLSLSAFFQHLHVEISCILIISSTDCSFAGKMHLRVRRSIFAEKGKVLVWHSVLLFTFIR